MTTAGASMTVEQVVANRRRRRTVSLCTYLALASLVVWSVHSTIDPATGRRMKISAPVQGRAVVLWDRFGLGKSVLDIGATAKEFSGLPRREGLILFYGTGVLGEELRGCARPLP